MAFRIHIESPATAADVLAAIARVHGRPVPAPNGVAPHVSTVMSRVRGSSFRFRIRSPWPYGGSAYELHGTVEPALSGRVAVRARVGALYSAFAMLLIVGMAAFHIAVLNAGATGWWVGLAALGCYLLAMKAVDARVSRALDVPRYLGECLEQAVDEASGRLQVARPTA